MAKTDLLMPPEVYRRLFLYAELCPKEISGLGLIRKEEGRFYCDEIALVEQEVGVAHTDMSPEGLSEFLTRMGKERPDTWGNWKLWWHSHCDMGVAFSGTDEETLRELARVSGDWFFGLVTNKKRASQLYVATRDPIPLLGKLDEVKQIANTEDDALIEEVIADIEAHVTAPAPTPLLKTAVSRSGTLLPGLEDSTEMAKQLDANELEMRRRYAGVRQDSATLQICLMCGGDVGWKQGNRKADSLYLQCKGCKKGVSNCGCPILRNNTSTLKLLQLYWEENCGIEKVAAEAKRLLAPPTVQDDGRKHSRPRHVR